MSMTEFAMRIFFELRPMLPEFAAVVVLTVLVLPPLTLLCNRTWVSDRGFCIGSLFFGLTGTEILRLSCAWLRLIFLLVFIISFKKMNLLGYWIFLLPSLIAALCGETYPKKLNGLLWTALQTAGLLSANLICGYILDMDGSIGFLIVYIAMGLFLSLLGIYLFLLELDGISLARFVEAKKVWGSLTEN